MDEVGAVLVAALWPNVGMLSEHGDTIFAKRQRTIFFHRGSCVGKVVEANAGKDGWNCPNVECGFFNFEHRDYCCKCEKPKPNAPPKKSELRHKLFMFSQKELQQLDGGKTKVVVRQVSGTTEKMIVLMGGRAAWEKHMFVDNWYRCTMSPKDAAVAGWLRAEFKGALDRKVTGGAANPIT